SRTAVLAVAPGGEFAATIGDGPFLTLWDLESELTRPIEGHDALIASVAISPDGCILAAGDQSGNVYLWESSTWPLRARFSSGPGSINLLAFRPDARVLAVHASGASPWIYDVRSTPKGMARPMLRESFGLAAECNRLGSEDAGRAWQA